MTPTIDPSTTLAGLVTSHPDLAGELEDRSLDYCCGCQRTIAVAVESTFGHLRDELEPHLAKEEQTLFPMIRQLTAADGAPAPGPVTLQGLIAQMLREHDHAGELLELTDAYSVPPGGCASYTALYGALEELEADTHLHVHIGNNRLVPMVADLESHAGAHSVGTQR